MRTILIVDDDPHIGNMLEEALRREHYAVLRAYSGTEASYVLDRERPDLVLLDLMLPGLNGEMLLPRIAGIPVIVVSAKADVESKVSLLLGGAADYVTKPFELRELLARIAAQLRAAEGRTEARRLCFEDLVLDLELHTVTLDPSVSSSKAGQVVHQTCMENESPADQSGIGSAAVAHLTRTEFAILRLLMQNPAQVLSKSQLLERIGADTPDCTESSLKMHISNLRKKLRALTGRDYIEAVWGIGFRMKPSEED